MDVKNWDDFDYFNCIVNNSIALAQKQFFNNVITNIIQVQFPPPAIKVPTWWYTEALAALNLMV